MAGEEAAAGGGALGPLGIGLMGAQLLGSLYGMKSARRQRKKLKADLERRRLALIESKNLAIGRVAEGTAAAKAPLEALAERVRTEEGFRDPVLEQSLAAGAREQVGAGLRQVEATQTSASLAIPQQQLLMAAALSQSLLGTESRRLQRRMESTRALAGIYGQLSEITQSGAQSAAGIETQFAGMLQQEPTFNEEGNDPLASGLGGMLAFLQTDQGKEALGGLFSVFQGGPEAPQAAVAAPSAPVASGGVPPQLEWLRKLMYDNVNFQSRYNR